MSGPGDRPEIDPQLGPLSHTGGPTLTHPPLPFSPAVDAGDDARCPATDARGQPHRIDGDRDGRRRCDVGAVEYTGREPDSCDLTGDGQYGTPDASLWFAGCAGGWARWRCDLNGSGGLEAADLARHSALCASP